MRILHSFLMSLFLISCVFAESETTWIGPIQATTFNDTDTYSDDGTPVEGIRTSDQIRVDEAPTLSYHVVRKAELDALDVDLLIQTVSVSSLADPSTELLTKEGTADGDLLLAYDSAGDATWYVFDTTQVAEAVPYVVDGLSGSWYAVAGRYVNDDLTVEATLTANELMADDITVDSLTTIANATIGNNLAVTGTITTTNLVVTQVNGLNVAISGSLNASTGTIQELDVEVLDVSDSLNLSGSLDVTGSLSSGALDAFTVDASGNVVSNSSFSELSMGAGDSSLTTSTVFSSVGRDRTAEGVFHATATNNWAAFIVSIFDSADSNFPFLDFCYSQGSTFGSAGIVDNGDILGAIAFRGSDGTLTGDDPDFISGAGITATVAGTPGADDMPTSLTFSTTPDGSSTLVDGIELGPESTVVMSGIVDDVVGGVPVYMNNTTGQLGIQSSTGRHKDNITTVTKAAVSWVDDLKARSYERADGSNTYEVGLIAEELEQTLPADLRDDVIIYEPRFVRWEEKVKNGEVISRRPVYEKSETPLGIDYSKLIVPLLVRVQDLEKRVKALEASKDVNPAVGGQK